ncbi:MAG: hypothetical protein DRI71_09205 [Bacteroidetes bacterium]|nr:MAG: hypothetical protein DRI71_09205 [Bacteroidota bacterium]
MYKLLVASLLAIVFSSCQIIEPEAPTNDYKVHAYYVIPAEMNYLDDNANRVGRAIIEMQRWYQTATGGLTFELLDEENIIGVYFTDHESSYYEGDWWNLLLNEMKAKGQPIESSGTIAMIWVEGIQQVADNATALGADMCNGNCGAAILPIHTIIGTTWPPADLGVPFHEMGHALGLTHPVEEADLPLPTEQEPMLSSVMCQATIRTGNSNAEHGFLTNEKAILINNPFMKPFVNIYQDFWQTKIINYPVTGDVPQAHISFSEVTFHSYKFENNADTGVLYYWYFGDGSTSNEPTPIHEFGSSGLYNVTLMVTDANNMASRVSQFVEIQ